MSTEINGWAFTCTTDGCELKGIEYQAQSDQAECGGCGAIFTKASNG